MVQFAAAKILFLIVSCLFLPASGQDGWSRNVDDAQYNLRQKDTYSTLDSESITNGVITFSWELFKKVAGNRNVAISPLAPQLLLAYLNSVADGKTRDEIGPVISNLSPEDMDLKLKNVLGKANSKNTLSIKTAFFLDGSVNLNVDFQKRAAKLDIGVFNVGMSVPPVATKVINDWIAKTTKGLIKQAVNPLMDTTGVRMMLVNTIAFEGIWRKPFDALGKGDFEVAEGQFRSVLYMNKYEKLYAGLTELEGNYRALWVEIPYDQEEYSMYVFLPNERHNMDHMIEHMSLDNLQKIVFDEKRDAKKQVNITMPKFGIESITPLRPTLEQMGVHELFSTRSNLAFLSNAEELHVDDIIQSVRLEVDEKGTRAAAATVVNVITLSLAQQPQKIEIVVDQPFLAIVVDNKNKVPLFMAKIDEP